MQREKSVCNKGCISVYDDLLNWGLESGICCKEFISVKEDLLKVRSGVWDL